MFLNWRLVVSVTKMTVTKSLSIILYQMQQLSCLFWSGVSARLSYVIERIGFKINDIAVMSLENRCTKLEVIRPRVMQQADIHDEWMCAWEGVSRIPNSDWKRCLLSIHINNVIIRRYFCSKQTTPSLYDLDVLFTVHHGTLMNQRQFDKLLIFCWPCIIMYHNSLTNLIHFHFRKHFIVS
jgi:hypothetical protein